MSFQDSPLQQSVSHSTVIKLIKQLGENHDVLVKEWRNNIVSALLERNVSMLYFNQKQFQLLYFVQDDDLLSGSLLSCNSTVGERK